MGMKRRPSVLFSKRVIYMAHPVSGDIPGNLAEARRWVRALEELFDVAVVASWITECEVWDDADPAERAAGLERDKAVIERCDELWLVGPRISTGMAVELTHARLHGVAVRNLTRWTSVDEFLHVNATTPEMLRALDGYRRAA